MKLFDRLFLKNIEMKNEFTNKYDNVTVLIDGVKIPAKSFEVSFGIGNYLWSDVVVRRDITLRVKTDAGI